eukprot:scaffold126776_cov54-Phaeocystis_antarctica.AAC.3
MSRQTGRCQLPTQHARGSAGTAYLPRVYTNKHTAHGSLTRCGAGSRRGGSPLNKERRGVSPPPLASCNSVAISHREAASAPPPRVPAARPSSARPGVT